MIQMCHCIYVKLKSRHNWPGVIYLRILLYLEESGWILTGRSTRIPGNALYLYIERERCVSMCVCVCVCVCVRERERERKFTEVCTLIILNINV